MVDNKVGTTSHPVVKKSRATTRSPMGGIGDQLIWGEGSRE